MGIGNAINLHSSAGLVNFNSSAFGTTTVTQYGTLIGGSAQALTSLSTGSAGSLLLSGGASANPSYVVPTVGTGLTLTSSSSQLTFNQPHGWTLIQTLTASSSSSLLFSSGVTGYTYYMLVGSAITQSANSYGRIYLSTDGGSTFLNMGWGNYGAAYVAAGIGVVDNTTGTAVPFSSTTTTTQTQTCFTAIFTNITTGGIPSFYFSTSNNQGSQASIYYGGAYATAGAATCNAIKIDRNTGTFSGTFKLFGLA